MPQTATAIAGSALLGVSCLLRRGGAGPGSSSGARNKTLPVKLWDAILFEVTPLLPAISTLCSDHSAAGPSADADCSRGQISPINADLQHPSARSRSHSAGFPDASGGLVLASLLFVGKPGGLAPNPSDTRCKMQGRDHLLVFDVQQNDMRLNRDVSRRFQARHDCGELRTRFLLQARPAALRQTSTGGLVADMLGYNWQSQRLVYGLETDFLQSGAEIRGRDGPIPDEAVGLQAIIGAAEVGLAFRLNDFVSASTLTRSRSCSAYTRSARAKLSRPQGCGPL